MRKRQGVVGGGNKQVARIGWTLIVFVDLNRSQCRRAPNVSVTLMTLYLSKRPAYIWYLPTITVLERFPLNTQWAEVDRKRFAGACRDSSTTVLLPKVSKETWLCQLVQQVLILTPFLLI